MLLLGIKIAKFVIFDFIGKFNLLLILLLTHHQGKIWATEKGQDLSLRNLLQNVTDNQTVMNLQVQYYYHLKKRENNHDKSTLLWG